MSKKKTNLKTSPGQLADSRLWKAREKHRAAVEGEVETQWQETTLWKDKVKRVMKAQESGFDTEQIIALTGIEGTQVQRIIEDEQIQDKFAKQNFKNKIPLIKDVIGMGLERLKEALKEMADPDVRKEMLKKPSDLASLTSVITGLNNLLRLEQGQSTENVASSTRTFQETRLVLQDLSKRDPVFGEQYQAALPEPSSES